MINFIKNMLSGSDDVSHKRSLSVASFLVLIGMVIMKGFAIPIDDTLIYVFACLTGGESFLTVIEKFKK